MLCSGLCLELCKKYYAKKTMMKLNEIQKGSFIFECNNALPDFICDDIVTRFESNPKDHYQGRVGAEAIQNTALKTTTDLVVTGRDHWQDAHNNLFRSLSLCLQEFSRQHDYFADLKRFKDMGYNLQRYQQGEYYHWHVDADNQALSNRQLVAIWYLNDVEQGGSTDFYHQHLSVQPEKGKLILFPPFWTHQHRAAIVERGTKYIATTWITFR